MMSFRIFSILGRAKPSLRELGFAEIRAATQRRVHMYALTSNFYS